MCVCVYVCHVYAGHLSIDGSASYFTHIETLPRILFTVKIML